MSSYYTGWALPESERQRLLLSFPPIFPDVIAEHVTLAFGVGADAPLPEQTEGFVVGHATDHLGVEALVVEIDGFTKRPDGKIFHITWSIDRAKKAKPVHSNAVIERNGVEWLPRPVLIRLVPRRFETR